MPKKTSLNASPKPSKRNDSVVKQGGRAAKDTQFGRDLIAGAKQILAHVQRRKTLKEYTLPEPVNVKAIREKTGMSQAEFAAAFCLNRRTLQDWERGRTAPDLAGRAYLTVIERDPDAVRNALRT